VHEAVGVDVEPVLVQPHLFAHPLNQELVVPPALLFYWRTKLHNVLCLEMLIIDGVSVNQGKKKKKPTTIFCH
jgi:hypothetical protein